MKTDYSLATPEDYSQIIFLLTAILKNIGKLEARGSSATRRSYWAIFPSQKRGIALGMTKWGQGQ
jgi:hypothetical protein